MAPLRAALITKAEQEMELELDTSWSRKLTRVITKLHIQNQSQKHLRPKIDLLGVCSLKHLCMFMNGF